MNTINEWLASDVVYQLGWMLLHSLWLIVLPAVLLAVVLLPMPKRMVNARYLASIVALVAMVGMFVVAALLVPDRKPSDAAGSTANETSENAIGYTLNAEELTINDGVNELRFTDGVNLEASGKGEPTELAETSDALPPADQQTSGVLAGEGDASSESNGWLADAVAWLSPCAKWTVPVWLIGVLIVGLWHLGGLIAVHRLRSIGTRPAPQAAVDLMQTLIRQMRVNRTVQLLESAIVQSPAVIGWLKPVILLPSSVVTGYTPEQLEVILAHELAHIRRHDYLVNLIQTLIVTLLFYHPAVWWVSRQICNERECCCDDMVVRLTDRKLAYAQTLAQMAESQVALPRFALASSGGALIDRLRRIAGFDDAPTASPKAWFAGLMLLLLAVALPITMIACQSDHASEVITAAEFRDQERDPAKAILGRWELVQEDETTVPSGAYYIDFTEQLTMLGYEGDRIDFDNDYRLAVKPVADKLLAWKGKLYVTDQFGKETEHALTMDAQKIVIEDLGEGRVILRRPEAKLDPAKAILGKWYGQFVDGSYLPSGNWCVWEFRADGTNIYALGQGEPVADVDPARNESMVTDYKIDGQGRLVLYLPGEAAKACPFEIHGDTIYISVDEPNDFVFTREPKPETYQKRREAAWGERGTARVEACRLLSIQWMKRVNEQDNEPTDLVELIGNSPELALSPLVTPDGLPDAFEGWDAKQRSAWLEKHAGFAYLPVGGEGVLERMSKGKLPKGHVLIFERPTEGRDTLLVVRVGEHGMINFPAQPMASEQLDALLKQQTGKGLSAWTLKQPSVAGAKQDDPNAFKIKLREIDEPHALADHEKEVREQLQRAQGEGAEFKQLLVVAKAHRENLAKIDTWTGKADVKDVHVDLDGDGHNMTSAAEFISDRQQGKRWRWEVTAADKTVDGVKSEDPRQISVLDQMIHEGKFYQCKDGFKPAGSDDWERTMVVLSAGDENERAMIGMKSRSLDPNWYLTDDGNPISPWLEWMYEKRDELKGFSVTRDGSIVTVETVLNLVVNRHQFDLDQGGNLVRMEASDSTSATWDTQISYTQIKGAWVPAQYEQSSRTRKGLRERVVVFKDQLINEPVTEAQFTMEAMGIQKDARVSDHVEGLFYEYPNIADARTITKRGDAKAEAPAAEEADADAE